MAQSVVRADAVLRWALHRLVRAYHRHMEVLRASDISGVAAALDGGWHLLQATAAPDGGVVLLSSDKPDPWREAQHGRQIAGPFGYRVHWQAGAGFAALDLQPTDQRLSHVQPLAS